MSEHHKLYREDNKEKLRQKHNCECGGTYTHQHKLTHQKTIKHCQYIEAQKATVINDVK